MAPAPGELHQGVECIGVKGGHGVVERSHQNRAGGRDVQDAVANQHAVGIVVELHQGLDLVVGRVEPIDMAGARSYQQGITVEGEHARPPHLPCQVFENIFVRVVGGELLAGHVEGGLPVQLKVGGGVGDRGRGFGRGIAFAA